MAEHKPQGSLSHSTLRSHASMRGLLLAEVGDSMVELDISGGGSGFKEGQRINFATMTPGINSSQGRAPPDLARHGTLLTIGATPERNAAELKSILGNSHARLKPGSSLLPDQGRRVHNLDDDATGGVSLEQAKPRARVEVDIVLRSNTCVQGGYLQGHVKIRIRKRARKEAMILISGGKVRVVGFECISNEGERHAFYQYSEPLANISTRWRLGARPPFSMLLPLSSDHGTPKGIFPTQSGAPYAILPCQDQSTSQRSIAHFYPFQNSLYGGAGKLTLTASIHRLHWIAGQQCLVNIQVTNDTKKTVKSLTLSLLRSTIVFKPHPHLDALPGGVSHGMDPDACQTSTTQKNIAESTLEMGQRGARGHASAKGWWTGVRPGERQEFAHFILIPPDALSVTRGRLLEVEHSLRVLPIRIVNFLSVDPPPSTPLPGRGGGLRRSDTALVAETYIAAQAQHTAHTRPVVRDLFGSASAESGNGGWKKGGGQEDMTLDCGLGIEDLANPTLQDNSVPHAQADNGYGDNALRFSDLYYQTAHESATGQPTDQPGLDRSSAEQKTDNSELEAADTHERRPNRPHGLSSFARRVQEKLDAISQVPVDGTVLDIPPPIPAHSSASEHHTAPALPDANTSTVELGLKTSATYVAGGNGHGSAFLVASVRGSRMLPKPPGGPEDAGGDGFATLQKLAEIGANDRNEDHEPKACTKAVASEETQEKLSISADSLSHVGETTIAPPPLIQRKIRELEERTRMAG
ncbi:hypothetical protein BD779DRAFT_1486738 [Infundibulicybe gibba]|nr:hypothetical protein BD779DRAFT_1486738 [Infundibulicybe gibba]